jgi:hypothetical protein
MKRPPAEFATELDALLPARLPTSQRFDGMSDRGSKGEL